MDHGFLVMAPPQQPLDQQQQEQTEGDGINGSALWQSDPCS
jgi:hypothetical protein